MTRTTEDGREFVWVPDHADDDGLGAWRVLEPDAGKLCRRCRKPAVAELNRGMYVRDRGKVAAWWAYCARHLYGRRIREGRVEIEVHPDSARAKAIAE